MQQNIFYVIVAVKVESRTPFTNETMQDITTEMNYFFEYENGEHKITGSEIKDISSNYPG